MADTPFTPPDWLRQGFDHIWLPYTQMQDAALPAPIARTEGCRLIMADGRELVDGVASWWTAAHGYNHPHIRQAVQQQLETMPHVMFGGLAHEPAYRLATRLAALTPGDLTRVFFSESGSVSVEIAMKMAVQYWINKGERGHSRFVSFTGGYHGDTFATMSVCDPEEGMHSLFAGLLAEQILTDLPTSEAARQAFDDLLAARKGDIAAVVTEPLVQGAGGMLFHSAETLRFIREACDRHGVLLIVDEIFTGFGRTGSLFACDQAGIVPDIMTLSKALTGGTLPLAATIARQHVFDAFLSDSASTALMHGPTYMGNAMGCAAANAALDLFEQDPPGPRADRIATQLAAELEPARQLPGVRDVRVLGAIGVIELDPHSDHDWMKAEFIRRGVWVRPYNFIIYTTPPLVISPEELSTLTTAMVDVVRLWGGKTQQEG
ncbi:adenosylmethionine--8-amino-7-oxononanoate transaminase [Pyruvatibacter mobilis]|uniref:adenosylmethionine--8-amino-7-oxononanoate transaminase n=1 Tax=Pyruvatibacter mobilis TaxID=1712261 RepID=UPI003C7C5890